MLNKNLTPDQIALFNAIEKNDVDGAKCLVEKLSSEELACEKDTFKQTPLHLALRMNLGADLKCKDTIAIAIINKLSPEQLNLPDINGDTPLKYAFVSGTDKSIKLLVNKLTSDSLSKGDEKGNTPLHWLAKQSNCDMSVLWSLLSKLPKKAFIAENCNRMTPFDMTTMSKSSVGNSINVVYGLLKDHGADSSLEMVVSKELIDQFLGKLFIKSQEIAQVASK